MKDRKAWNDVVQKIKLPCKVVVEEEEEKEEEKKEEEKKKSLQLNYDLFCLINTFKYNIIYEYLYIIVYVTNTE